MKLDSEEQRKQVLELLGKVPVQTNLEALLAGPSPEIVTLVKTIRECPLEDGTPSALLAQGAGPQLSAGDGGAADGEKEEVPAKG